MAESQAERREMASPLGIVVAHWAVREIQDFHFKVLFFSSSVMMHTPKLSVINRIPGACSALGKQEKNPFF